MGWPTRLIRFGAGTGSGSAGLPGASDGSPHLQQSLQWPEGPLPHAHGQLRDASRTGIVHPRGDTARMPAKSAPCGLESADGSRTAGTVTCSRGVGKSGSRTDSEARVSGVQLDAPLNRASTHRSSTERVVCRTVQMVCPGHCKKKKKAGMKPVETIERLKTRLLVRLKNTNASRARSS